MENIINELSKYNVEVEKVNCKYNIYRNGNLIHSTIT